MRDKRLKGHTWLFLCALLLIIVHTLFRTPAPYPWLEHVWGAGDFITFVGTMVLGYVAYWQTNNANETNDRLLKLEEARYKLELRPFIMVTDFKAYAKIESELLINPDRLYIQVAPNADLRQHVLCIDMALTNTTNSFITAEYSGAKSEDGAEWRNSVGNQGNLKIAINGGNTGNVVFYAPSDFFKGMCGQHIRFRFILENRLSKAYAQEFDMIVTALSGTSVGCSPTGKWFLSMRIQNHSIARFETTNGEIIEIPEEL